MHLSKRIRFGMGFSLVAVAVLITLFFTSPTQPFCPLSRVSAQDNPCLVQESTITALELQLLQVRGTMQAQEVSFQSTLAAIESDKELDTEAADEILPGNVLFADSFDDNSLGWNIFTQEEGRATVNDGILTLQVNPCENVWLLFPNFELPVEFYMETDVLMLQGAPGVSVVYVGFGLGDATNGQYHSFAVSDGQLEED